MLLAWACLHMANGIAAHYNKLKECLKARNAKSMKFMILLLHLCTEKLYNDKILIVHLDQA